MSVIWSPWDAAERPPGQLKGSMGVLGVERESGSHQCDQDHRVHTYRLVVPSFQQSVEAASLAHSQLKRHFLNPTDGSSYGLFCHRNSIFLPFHRPLGNPERNHTGCNRGSGQPSCQPSVSEVRAASHLPSPELNEREHSSWPSESCQYIWQAI